MKKSISVFLFLIFFIMSVTITHSEETYTIDGNNVYVNNSNAYLSAEPHTIYQSGWVYFNATAKSYTGDADFIWGFDTDATITRKAEYYNPRDVEVQRSYTCVGADIWYNYTISPNHFWCWYNRTYDNVTYEDVLIFDHDFDSYDVPTSTAYWTENVHEDWQDISDRFDSLNYDFGGMNKWYYITDVAITAGQNYQMRAWVDVPITASGGKYWFGVKPSTETLSQAIASGHFYYLDPWWNSTWTSKEPIVLTLPATGTSGVTKTNWQAWLNISYDVEMNSDFSDLRFLNGAEDTSLPYYIKEKVDGQFAYVTVLVPSFNATNQTTIWMYFDNALATDAGNKTATYIYAEDFEDNNLSKYSGNLTYYYINATDPLAGNYSLARAQLGTGTGYVAIYDPVDYNITQNGSLEMQWMFEDDGYLEGDPDSGGGWPSFSFGTTQDGCGGYAFFSGTRGIADSSSLRILENYPSWCGSTTTLNTSNFNPVDYRMAHTATGWWYLNGTMYYEVYKNDSSFYGNSGPATDTSSDSGYFGVLSLRRSRFDEIYVYKDPKPTYIIGEKTHLGTVFHIDWTSPTSANGTETFNKTYITWNMSSTQNLTDCYFTINGTNHTGNIVNGSSGTGEHDTYCYYNETGFTETQTRCADVFAANGTGIYISTGETICRELGIDLTNPAITIHSPTNTTYTTSNILINISQVEAYPNVLWYMIPNEDWDYEGYNLNATMHTSNIEPDNLNLIWHKSNINGSYGLAEHDGVLYSGEGTVFNAIYINGTLKWRTTGIGSSGFGDYAVAYYNGQVYMGNANDKYLYVLNAGNGSIVWNFTDGQSVRSGILPYDGKIYFSTGHGVYAFYENGTQIWNTSSYADFAYNWYLTTPVIYNNRMYIRTWSNKLNSLYLSNGSTEWQSSESVSGFDYSNIILVNETLYVGDTSTNAVRAYYLNGTQKWIVNLEQKAYRLTEQNGIVYYSGDAGMVGALYQNGTILWNGTIGSAAIYEAMTGNTWLYLLENTAGSNQTLYRVYTNNGTVDTSKLIENVDKQAKMILSNGAIFISSFLNSYVYGDSTTGNTIETTKAFPDGSNTVTAYSQDSYNHYNMTSISFTVSTEIHISALNITPDDSANAGFQVSPIESSTVTVTSSATISDPNYDTASCYLYNGSGTLTSTNSSVYETVVNASATEVQCSFTLQYYVLPQNFTVSMNASNTFGISGLSNATFEYLTLDAFNLSKASLSFSATVGSSDTDDFNVTNTGNYASTTQIKGEDLTNASYSIDVSNIQWGLSDPTPDTNMTTSFASVGTLNIQGEQQIYIELNVPVGTLPKAYSGSIYLQT